MSNESQLRNISKGLCSKCGQKPLKTGWYCSDCMEARKGYDKKRRAAKKEAGLCVNCGKNPLKTEVLCKQCVESGNLKRREKNKFIKDAVFAAYGGYVCACCGEDIEQFLSIDHVNNDGAAHRKIIGNGNLYRWLYKNNYPSGFQVLCMNCQWGKVRNGGICPHQIKEI